MEFQPTESQVLLRNTIGSILTGFGPQYWRRADQEHRFPIEFEKVLADAGLFATMLPEEYGGAGLGVAEAAIALRAIAESDAGLDGCSVMHMGLFGINPLVVHGTKAQKEEFLPRAARGELHTCFGVTEPNEGTDTTRISTVARRDGDDYVVNGRKVWISRAKEAERMLLLCRTTPYDQVAKKTDGMSLLFVPMPPPGLVLREIAKMGRHAVDSNEVFIDELRVPRSCLIGEEGHGFRCLLDGLNPERIMVAAEAVGLGFHVVHLAVTYAREREVFGRKIGQNQGVQLPLADAELAHADDREPAAQRGRRRRTRAWHQ